MQALPYAIPAAIAGLAYLDARHGISYDWPLFSSVARALIATRLHDRNDDYNIFYILEKHALSSSNRHRPFLIFEGETWTYKEAYEIVLKYGTWLKSKGVVKDEVVAIDFINSDVFIWVWYGLWSIGAKPAFINTNLTGKALVHTIRTSTAKLVLVDEHGRDKFNEDMMAEHGYEPTEVEKAVEVQQEGQNAVYGYESEPSQISPSIQRQANLTSVPTGTDTETPQRRVLEIHFFDKRLENYILSLKPVRQPNSERGNQKRDSMAMLIYTSGTTGLPKAAILSWGRTHGGGRFTHNWVPVKNTDILYTAMPLYHASASVIGIGTMLFAGGTTCISRSFSHKTFWPEVRASKATIVQYVGETCRYLLAAPPSPLDKQHHLHTIIGNGLRPDVWQPFKDRFNINKICEFYSATESPTGLFNKSVNNFAAGALGRNGTLAESLINVGHVVRIDTSNNAEPLRDPKTGLCYPAATDEPGELLFKIDAENIKARYQGYFRNEKASNSKILRDVKTQGDVFYRSGDLVRYDAEGRWYFVDRMGDTFRWKAENVSTAQVADILGKHPAIEEACVYGVEVPHHDGKAGCAAIVLRNKSAETNTVDERTLKSIAEHLDKELPVFARPVWLRVTREMPKTGTNKQQKHVLQKSGIDVLAAELESKDVFYWRSGKEATYVRFRAEDLDKIKGGGVKL